MAKRDSFAIRKRILFLLKEGPLTLSQIERKINTNSRTVKLDCEELAFYRLISIEEKLHPSNGRSSFLINLTLNGHDITKSCK